LDDKVRISFKVNPDIREKLNELCDKDKRSQALEISWLIDRRKKELDSEHIYITSGIGG
jgi:hypothetical protein